MLIKSKLYWGISLIGEDLTSFSQRPHQIQIFGFGAKLDHICVEADDWQGKQGRNKLRK